MTIVALVLVHWVAECSRRAGCAHLHLGPIDLEVFRVRQIDNSRGALKEGLLEHSSISSDKRWVATRQCTTNVDEPIHHEHSTPACPESLVTRRSLRAEYPDRRSRASDRRCRELPIGRT